MRLISPPRTDPFWSTASHYNSWDIYQPHGLYGYLWIPVEIWGERLSRLDAGTFWLGTTPQHYRKPGQVPNRRYKKLSHRSNGFKDHQKRVIKMLLPKPFLFSLGMTSVPKGLFVAYLDKSSNFGIFCLFCDVRWKSLEWSLAEWFETSCS